MNYRISLFVAIFLSCAFLFSCTFTQSNRIPPLSAEAKKDSIRNDEITNPITHGHLSLSQRAVIRPIYIETERGISAKHKGYLIHLKLKNSAQSTTYKDIRVEVFYYAVNGNAIDKEAFFIKKSIKPGQTLEISKKILRYRNTNYKVKLASTIATE